MNKLRNLLTDYEIKILTNIAQKTGQDVWFCIKHNKQESDRIFDKKQNKTISLNMGIKLLLEKFDFDIFEALTDVEKWTLICLLADL